MSHAEGKSTVAANQYEHAEGRYNVSTVDLDKSRQTASSIGIGDEDERKNAVEVQFWRNRCSY